jgi:polyferredoxin
MIVFLLFAVVYGKLLCGKVCPFGIVQDWIYTIPFPVKIKTFRGDKILRYLKYLVLLFVLIMPFWGNTEPADEHSLPASGVLVSVLSLFTFLMIYRPFCKYLCPYGAFISLLNLIAPYKYRIDKNKCIDCNKCAKVCNMNIAVHKTPNHPECIRCGKCKKACPVKAVYTGFKPEKDCNL